jgi:methionyl aminopeptidase
MRIWKENKMRIFIKDKNEIRLMQESGEILALVLSEMERKIAPGIFTEDLDRLAEEIITSHGAKPAFKGYKGFPKTICSCINEEIVHGIPGKRELKEGDIITIDCGVVYKDFYSDSAITRGVGIIKPEAEKLIKTSEKALKKAIEIAKPGIRIRDISRVIEKTVAKNGFSIIKDLVGHGIGKKLHEDPQIPNFVDKTDPGPLLQPGMTLAIEPIISAGNGEAKVGRDQWTYITKDGSLSAQTEHTIAITEKGCIILTKREAENW